MSQTHFCFTPTDTRRQIIQQTIDLVVRCTAEIQTNSLVNSLGACKNCVGWEVDQNIMHAALQQFCRALVCSDELQATAADRLNELLADILEIRHAAFKRHPAKESHALSE